MAQIKKEEIQNRILTAAKKVFLKDGFAKASMRDIADQAEVTLSNLYNYYRDKDDLFTSVLEPCIQDILQLCERGKAQALTVTETPFETLAEKKQYFLAGVSYIDRQRSDLQLLFNLSSGSKLESFSEILAREYEQTWDIRFNTLRDQFPNHQYSKPSSFFLRSMAHFHLAILKQVLVEDLPVSNIRAICEEWVTFIWHGGIGIIK